MVAPVSAGGNETVATRLERVRERLAAAAMRAGRRPEEITLVGATKTVDAGRVAAAIAAGLHDFGENYVQEAQAKLAAPALRSPEVRWHLIGHLQTNKARTALDLFAIIQTLDSARLATVLARHASARGKRPSVLLEVDYTGAADRTGLRPEAVPEVVEALLALPALEVAGLMTVPALGLSAQETRGVFRRLRALRDELAARYPTLAWHHLSMGMTEDFEMAIEEGATIVRIGRAIFGERPA
jgi:pyridoxal phosphate enzyme (YggS family)